MADLLLAAVFVALLVGTEAFFSLLEVLNLRHEATAVEREADWIRAELDVDDPQEIVDYHRAKTGVALLRQWVILALVLVVLFTGVFADAVAVLQSLGVSPLLEGGLFVAGALIAYRLAGVPFALVETFVVEEIFGFNQQSPRLWLRDFLVGTALAVVLAVPLAVAIFWAVDAITSWPVAAWVIVMGFQLGLLVLKPRVIDPLFYDFERLDAGDLREAVDEVFERAGFACDQVYEMDYSTRSSHSNAYFVGFGRTKRVVLFDTLIENMDRREIQGVLAHELAHWKRGHIWKFVALAGIELALVLALLWGLVETGVATAPLTVPTTTYATLTVALLWVVPLSRLLSPVQNYFSLRYEREADAFAAETVGGEPMADALANLAGENLSTLFPHRLYETFHYSHPPIPERMRELRGRAGGSDAGSD